jgi:hypothetical protein
MARTKSPESKSSENAEALLPAKKYEPTAVERPIVDKYYERYNQRPPPMKITSTDIRADHPDVRVGGILAMQSIGTANEHVYTGIVGQLVDLVRPAGGGPASERDLNVALALVQEVKPRDGVEGMLAVQMAGVHLAAMQAAKRLAKVENIPQQDSASRMFNQLSRTFVAQVEGLKKYRATGEQTVKVQHITVSDGGQAVVAGSMQTGGGRGVNGKNDH